MKESKKELGKKIKNNKENNYFLTVFVILGIYFSILIFFSAYIFWPRQSEITENGISTKQFDFKFVDGTKDVRIEEDFFPFYRNIYSSIYSNDQIILKEGIFTAVNEEYILQVRSIPKRYDPETIKQQILEILGSDSDNYGIYFYDLTRDIEIGINHEKIFPPMSISKLPVGLMMMREIDKGNFSLDSLYEFSYDSVADPTNVLDASFVGVSFSISDYLRFLIIDSDNSSIRKLENLMGGYLVLNEKVKTELGVEHFFRDPHDATAKDVGRVLRGLYNQEYLSAENNAYFINLLQNTHWSLQDGIPVGFPEPYKSKIAHKTGQGSSEPGCIWEDAALVFGEKSGYILVILNEKIDIPIARYNIQ